MVRIELINNKRKPLFQYRLTEDYSVTVLLDTGASMSIFDNSFRSIKSVFPNAYKSDKSVKVASIDGAAQYDVWIVPEMKLKTITFKNVPFVCRPLGRFGVGIILSAELFHVDGFAVCYRNNSLVLGDGHKVIYCSLAIDIATGKVRYFYTFMNDTEVT